MILLAGRLSELVMERDRREEEEERDSLRWDTNVSSMK
jgi:hypothetical protein